MTATDTDRAGFIEAIVRSPADDTPRLVFADWLEEHGDGPWGELIRVQIELAKMVAGYTPRCDHRQGGCPGCKWRRARGRLWKREHKVMEWFCTEDMASFFGLPNHQTLEPIFGGLIAVGLEVSLHFYRGFVSRVVCPADEWPRIADDLYWHPGQTVRCPQVGCSPVMYGPRKYRMFVSDGPDSHWADCPQCEGTGHFLRPCPPTAQPITNVRITDGIPWEVPGWEGLRFVEGDSGYKCPKWPGVLFHFADY